MAKRKPKRKAKVLKSDSEEEEQRLVQKKKQPPKKPRQKIAKIKPKTPESESDEKVSDDSASDEMSLMLRNTKFKIIPNTGKGDCLFKAIAQAIEGTEEDHHKIREKVVNFVVNNEWDKFKEAIEVQHFDENQVLQKKWTLKPIETYENYMNTLGTLGSSIELTAAGQEFGFNFVTIQEYTEPSGNKYRVENCCPFNDDQSAPFFCFYFTGDYENGHWQYLAPVSVESIQIEDGMYTGVVK